MEEHLAVAKVIYATCGDDGACSSFEDSIFIFVKSIIGGTADGQIIFHQLIVLNFVELKCRYSSSAVLCDLLCISL